MADIKLLMVADSDRFNYGPKQMGPNALNFAVTKLVAALQNSTTPSIQVVKAHRHGSSHGGVGSAPDITPDLTIGLDIAGDFVFSDAALADIDVVWLLCDEGKNGGTDTPGTGITPAEKEAIARFMDRGGGVFAVGDHDGVGSKLGGDVLRIRLMRRWQEADDAPSINGQAIAGNWSVSGADRNDTLRPDSNGSGLYYFDDQGDPTPQDLTDKDGNPFATSGLIHTIMRDRVGNAIDKFPDHMHEGEATDFASIVPSGTYNPNDGLGHPFKAVYPGQSFDEFRKDGDGVFQPKPEVICYGTDVGHTTHLGGTVYTQTTPKIGGKVSAYDGRSVGVGRAVTGSTFHHYIDKNLIGDPGTAFNPPTGSDQGLPAAVLSQMDDYFVNVATWLSPQNPSFHFLTIKNTYGLDETQNTPAGFPDAFYLVIEGFTPNAVGMAPVIALGGPFKGAGATFQQGAPFFPDDPSVVQRILIPFKVVSIPLAAFPPSAPKLLVLDAHIAISGNDFFAEALFELTPGADPYFSNVDPGLHNHFYLSRDLRVFQVTPNLVDIPFDLTFTDPAQFIHDLLQHLNGPAFNHPGGTDPFDVLSEANDLIESSSVVSTKIGPNSMAYPNYNFALARVRLKGGVGTPATGVRVFFRLYETQSNDTDYDQQTSYRCTYDAKHLPERPLPGIDGLNTPMFATGSANTDYPGPNQQDLSVVAGGETWAYYCCWLNVYNNPGVTLVGTHHCLVAEIACDDAPIQGSSGITLSPENSDKLAQRNINITPSGNPTGPAGHRIPQTFEVRPSLRNTAAKASMLLGYPDELMIDWGNVPRGSTATIYWPQAKAIDIVRLSMMLYSSDAWRVVDENTVQCTVKSRVSYLPIPFGTGPSFAGLFTIDLPLGVRHGQQFEVVVRRLSTRQPNIIGIKQDGLTHQTVAARQDTAKQEVARKALQAKAAPAKAEAATPGYKPRPSREGVAEARKMQPAHIEPVKIETAPRRAVEPGARPLPTRDWRYVVGTFQVTIPVKLERDMLWDEENTYAVMKWRLGQTASTNRWYPVLKRYLGYLAGRVDAFGGNSGSIKASPCGVPPARGHGGGEPGHGEPVEMTGKVCDVLYNCFGEFEGFVLNTCSSSHSFMSCERGIGDLVMRACQDRLTLTVFVEREGSHKIRKVIVRCC